MATTMTVGGTRFQLITEINEMWSLGDEDGMVLTKTEESVGKLQAFLAGYAVRTMVEVGIHRGGSTALFAEWLDPERLAAIDIEAAAPALDAWIERRGRQGRVRPFYGVDQDDADRLRAIHADYLCGEAIDLVNDDASHELDRTRATFNVLFPLLRPGGLYLIEDWAWHELTRGFEMLRPPALSDDAPLSRLVSEIVSVAARCRDLVAEVVVNDAFVAVRRGPLAVTGPFDIRAFA